MLIFKLYTFYIPSEPQNNSRLQLSHDLIFSAIPNSVVSSFLPNKERLDLTSPQLSYTTVLLPLSLYFDCIYLLTMAPFQRILLLALAFIAATTVQCSAVSDSDAAPGNAGVRGARQGSLSQRRLKDDKARGMNDDKPNNNLNSFGNNNGNSFSRENANGLIEPPPGQCAPFELAGIQDRARSSLTDTACKTNSCNNGCCRMYNWLICDTSNSFSHLQCVCNANTNPLPPTAPPTNRPTKAPTLPPVADRRDETPSPVVNTIVTTTAAPVTPAPIRVTPAPVTVLFRPTPAPATKRPTPGPTKRPTQPPVFVARPTPGPTKRPTQPPVFVARPTPGPTKRPTQPPVTPAPVFVAPWQQCAGGSSYHDTASTGKCFYSEDCQEKNECCIRNFCLCASAQGMTDECVPSRFN